MGYEVKRFSWQDRYTERKRSSKKRFLKKKKTFLVIKMTIIIAVFYTGTTLRR